MSALETSYLRGNPARGAHLHIVREGETSAHFRRKLYAQEISRARSWAQVRVYVNLSSALGFFAMALTSVAVAFLSIPNTPLP
ncbi:MAG: hypothetical protein LBG99_00920 [Propionibacteriaceae bacterium]|jgi:hypothetical protein|nr:hypothetical protein [Propionibacteriaceae bacterium]